MSDDSIILRAASNRIKPEFTTRNPLDEGIDQMQKHVCIQPREGECVSSQNVPPSWRGHTIVDQNAHLYQSIGDTIVLLFRSFDRGLVVAADSFGNVGEFQKGFLKETKAWLT
jgi:hypothetical protein